MTSLFDKVISMKEPLFSQMMDWVHTHFPDNVKVTVTPHPSCQSLTMTVERALDGFKNSEEVSFANFPPTTVTNELLFERLGDLIERNQRAIIYDSQK